MTSSSALLGVGVLALLGATNARRAAASASWLGIVRWPAALAAIELAPLLIVLSLGAAILLAALDGLEGAAGWGGLGALLVADAMTVPSMLGARRLVLHVDHPLAGPYRAAVDRLGLRRDNVPSFGLGWGPTPLPRPQDAYLHFHRPIETERLAGRHDDRKTLERVRDQVAAAIQDGLQRLAGERARHGNPGVVPRVRRFITGGPQQ